MQREAETQPNVLQVVPFFWVQDLGASLRFYVDGLGCRITHRWESDGKLRWCWLELGGAALMLQESWPEGHHNARPLRGPAGEGVTINLICRDALSIYREALARGLSPARPYVGNGMWVTAIIDPDGYHLEFESPTDAPGGSLYEG